MSTSPCGFSQSPAGKMPLVAWSVVWSTAATLWSRPTPWRTTFGCTTTTGAGTSEPPPKSSHLPWASGTRSTSLPWAITSRPRSMASACWTTATTLTRVAVIDLPGPSGCRFSCIVSQLAFSYPLWARSVHLALLLHASDFTSRGSVLAVKNPYR
jgi:hypothetical protein